MNAKKSLVVLITGCSTGIGRALAAAFARAGHQVIATARRPETLADLDPAPLAALPLDVTSAASIAAAVEAAAARAGRIDVLVNNAGFGLMGPALELPPDELRRQLETNVVGPLAVAQAVAPLMIAQGGGVIVNVGSVSGVLTTPFAGAYCASKAALHSLTDALRMELAPFGVEVMCLQPGGVASHFGDTAAQIVGKILPPNSRYASIARFIEGRAREGQRGAMAADEFAGHVVEAATRPRPPAIFRLAANSIRLPLYRWLLPVGLTDRILTKRFGLDRLRAPAAGEKIGG
jgi:NAD(P)-dependent dehydrogenase (short-subunit alcohol dehydrogenase family)